MMRIYIAALTLIFLVLPASAQDIYSQAENAYKIGRIDSALVLLKRNENSFHGTDKQKAYRLMSLCCLALDQTKAFTSPVIITFSFSAAKLLFFQPNCPVCQLLLSINLH